MRLIKKKMLRDYLNRKSATHEHEEAIIPTRDTKDMTDEAESFRQNTRSENSQRSANPQTTLTTQSEWADQRIGEILVDLKKIRSEEIEWILRHQRDKGVYFGEAAIQLGLVESDDVFQALARQFGYPYTKSTKTSPGGLVAAHTPLGEQSEMFRSIRSQLLMRWFGPNQKKLAVVSPDHNEGRSYIAANLAIVFAQLGRSTLLIDADLRAPKQHIIFDFPCRIGLSTMLAGRISKEDLERVANPIQYFRNLSVLGGGAVPPNSVELFSSGRFPLMLEELGKYFDVIIIDTPPAKLQSDLLPIASAAGSALMVVKRHSTKMDDIKELEVSLLAAGVHLAGSVLNQF